jgi:hypothetical protein
MTNPRLLTWSRELSIFNPKKAWPLFTLCILATVYAIREKWYPVLYLAVWVSAGYFLLTQLEPHWYHHELLVTIPASILASIPVGEAIEVIRGKLATTTSSLYKSIATPLSIFTFIAFIASHLPHTIQDFRIDLPNLRAPAIEPDEKMLMLAIISDYADDTDLMITDRPMFAFRSGIAVPPELAVFSGKQFLTGELTETDVLRAIDAKKPGQVALTRFNMLEVVDYLEDGYHRVFSNAPYLLFIRNDIYLEN